MQLESKKLQIQITEKEWEGQKILLVKGGATEKDVNNAENSYIVLAAFAVPVVVIYSSMFLSCTSSTNTGVVA